MNQALCRALPSLGVIVFALLAGCSSVGPALPPGAPKVDPAVGTDDYWLAKPGAASVYADDYDRLWDTCGDIARDKLFDLDREDYRDGLLTTHAMVSRQFFEPWRSDAGDSYAVAQSSLQTIRRSIHFEFSKLSGGYVVTPKVIVERLAQLTTRITSSSQYTRAYSGVPATAKDAAEQAALTALADSTEHWYCIGRDVLMEAEIAHEIQQRIGG